MTALATYIDPGGLPIGTPLKNELASNYMAVVRPQVVPKSTVRPNCVFRRRTCQRMTTRLTDTARMCHRLPEDALAQAFARLPVDVFTQVTTAVAEVLMDDIDQLLDRTRDYR